MNLSTIITSSSVRRKIFDKFNSQIIKQNKFLPIVLLPKVTLMIHPNTWEPWTHISEMYCSNVTIETKEGDTHQFQFEEDLKQFANEFGL